MERHGVKSIEHVKKRRCEREWKVMAPVEIYQQLESNPAN